MQRAYKQPYAVDGEPDESYWSGRKVLAVFQQPVLKPGVLEAMAEQLTAQREAFGPQFDVQMDLLIGGNFIISRKLDRGGR